jgi:Mg2+ and Co2+ transporter CorA
MNLTEVVQKLRQTEETILLELLELTSDDIVDAFLDRIEDNYTRVIRFIEETE